MPQLDLDGANSKISADTIRGQSGTTVTVQSGHNLVGSGSGLTALPAGNLTGTLPAISGASLTSLNATNLGSGTVPDARLGGDKTCKAWVNYTGGATPAIVDSFNFASITDNGTGDFTLNFTTNLGNTNFAAVAHGFDLNHNANIECAHISTLAVGSVRVLHQYTTNATAVDSGTNTVIVFGDS